MKDLEVSIRSICEELVLTNEALFSAIFDDCPVISSVSQQVTVEPQPPAAPAPPPSPPHPVVQPQAEEEEEDEFFWIVCSIKHFTSYHSTSTSPLP